LKQSFNKIRKSFMTEVVIAGIGQTEVGEHWDIGLRELAYAAIHERHQDSGGLKPQSLFVGNMLAPNLSGRRMSGSARGLCRLLGIEAVTIEAAGASGGAALRQGYLAIASGMVDVALVVGVEKFTDKVGSGVDEAVAHH
jgi:acetyl-CoA C-acetyltransferase